MQGSLILRLKSGLNYVPKLTPSAALTVNNCVSKSTNSKVKSDSEVSSVGLVSLEKKGDTPVVVKTSKTDSSA